MEDDETVQGARSGDPQARRAESQRRAALILRARTAVEGLDWAVHELQNILNGMREAFRQRSLPPVDYATQHWLRGAEWEILSLEEEIASIRADVVEWNHRVQEWEEGRW